MSTSTSPGSRSSGSKRINCSSQLASPPGPNGSLPPICLPLRAGADPVALIDARIKVSFIPYSLHFKLLGFLMVTIVPPFVFLCMWIWMGFLCTVIHWHQCKILLLQHYMCSREVNLTEEEKEILKAEGLPIPTTLPLTKVYAYYGVASL